MTVLFSSRDNFRFQSLFYEKLRQVRTRFDTRKNESHNPTNGEVSAKKSHCRFSSNDDKCFDYVISIFQPACLYVRENGKQNRGDFFRFIKDPGKSGKCCHWSIIKFANVPSFASAAVASVFVRGLLVPGKLNGTSRRETQVKNNMMWKVLLFSGVAVQFCGWENFFRLTTF